MTETWYRYEDHRESLGVDQWDNPYPGFRSVVTLSEFSVLRHTPKGVWLTNKGLWGGTSRHFVRNEARKRFACPTKEDALESYIARKKRQIQILEDQVKHATNCLDQAVSKMMNPDPL